MSMQHPITKNTYQVTLREDFDYLSAGIAYRATPEVNRHGKLMAVRFDREDESSGTTLRAYQWAMLRDHGNGTISPHPKRSV
jgi:hypothetical protein